MATRPSWETASRREKTATLCFVAYLMFQYAVVVADTLTRYDFSSAVAMRISDIVREVYDFAIMSTPNQLFITLFASEVPATVNLAVIGSLNVAVAFVISYLIIKRRWKPSVVAAGFVAVSLLFWVLAIAYP